MLIWPQTVKIGRIMEKKYELVGLFAVKVNDIVAEKTLADLARNSGFKIEDVDKWGVKPLAYPIKKEPKAYYLRLMISGGDAKKLKDSLKIEETLLRHLLIRLPDSIETVSVKKGKVK